MWYSLFDGPMTMGQLADQVGFPAYMKFFTEFGL